jgi:short-subunit dehydrogenase
MDTKNKTALITGATSGIGYELAKLFAKDNFDLVLVARSKETLEKVADELQFLGASRVVLIPADLSVVNSAQKIYEAIKEKSIEINILVNDAGVGQHGKFAEIEMERHLHIINLNIIALTQLTYYFVKEMITNGEGRILQLASMASYQPTPLLATYAATKAYVLSLTDALRKETEDTGVTLTALIPGPTDTDFFRKAEMENTVAAQDAENPATVAKIGYEALMNGEQHAIAPGVTKQIVMSSLMPNDTVASMAKKQMEPVDK